MLLVCTLREIPESNTDTRQINRFNTPTLHCLPHLSLPQDESLSSAVLLVHYLVWIIFPHSSQLLRVRHHRTCSFHPRPIRPMGKNPRSQINFTRRSALVRMGEKMFRRDLTPSPLGPLMGEDTSAGRVHRMVHSHRHLFLSLATREPIRKTVPEASLAREFHWHLQCLEALQYPTAAMVCHRDQSRERRGQCSHHLPRPRCLRFRLRRKPRESMLSWSVYKMKRWALLGQISKADQRAPCDKTIDPEAQCVPKTAQEAPCASRIGRGVLCD